MNVLLRTGSNGLVPGLPENNNGSPFQREVTSFNTVKCMLHTISVLLFILFPALLPRSAIAADRYVAGLDSAANDSNPGTALLPWKTIGKAALEVQPGDMVFVKSGTYVESVHIKVAQSGTSAAPIVFAVFPGDTVTLKGDLSHGDRSGILVQAAYLTFDGFEITGHRRAGIHVNSSNAHHITMKNLDSHNNDVGITLSDHASQIRIENADIHDNEDGVGNKRGIWLWGAEKVVIKNVRSYSNSHTADGDGITVSDSQDVIVDGCELYDNGEEGFDVGGHLDRDYTSSKDVLVQNCITYNNRGADFKTSGCADHAIVRRNISYPGASFNSYSLNTQEDNCETAPPETRDLCNSKKTYMYNNTFIQHAVRGSLITFGNCTRDYRFKLNALYFGKRAIFKKCSSWGHEIDWNYYYRTSSSTALITWNGWYNGELTCEDAPVCAGKGCWNGASYENNWTDYQSHTGQDTHSSCCREDFKLQNIDGPVYNLRPQKGSPLIDYVQGGVHAYLTKTANSGNGTQIRVKDAGYFFDGFWPESGYQGDLIRIGTQSPVRITSIDYENDIISIERSLSWGSGEPVNLNYIGAGPDIGAFEGSRPKAPTDLRVN